MNDEFETFVRIPVHFENGAWVTETGRSLIAANGTTAEFVMPTGAVKKLWPERDICVLECAQFLNQGAALRIAIRVRHRDELKDALLKHLISPIDMMGRVEWGTVQGWHSTEAHFIEVVLGDPTTPQKEKFPDFSGGLMVKVRGTAIEEVIPSRFNLPEGISDKKPLSLNHAYTILSEIYEVHRASHTGSIYQTIFYQGADDCWYPLGLLKKVGLELERDGHKNTENLVSEFWRSAEWWTAE